ncbi:MAG: glycosyltransferase, partial [bacterium]|nr:glycosyltransferase [bacterium]
MDSPEFAGSGSTAEGGFKLMEPPLLSASLIVKNEERRIRDCLLSLKPLVDEIVIVDTGSTDSTAAIATELGARVYDVPWHGFSEARNESIRRCSGQWILSIDADEVVRPGDHAHHRELLASTTAVALYILLHIRPGLTPYWRVRLFRNDPRIRFEGMIHEIVFPSISRIVAAGEGKIGHCPLVIEHSGYEEARRGKHERDVPLLLQSLSKYPDRLFEWTHLAIAYAGLGKPAQADEAWRTALDLARKRESIHRRYDSMAFIGAIEWRLSRGQDASALIEEAAGLFPESPHLAWFLGRLRMRQGRFREAIPIFEELLSQPEIDREGDSFGYDQRL